MLITLFVFEPLRVLVSIGGALSHTQFPFAHLPTGNRYLECMIPHTASDLFTTRPYPEGRLGRKKMPY